MGRVTRWWITGIVGASLFSSAFTVGLLRFERVNFSSSARQDTDFSKLDQIYQTLTAGYYVPVNASKLQEGAIAGMVKAIGDPFTDYFDPVEAKAFNAQLDPSFQGIGAVMDSTGGQVRIESVIKGSPAQRAGLKQGDIIEAVDGKSVKGMSLTHVQGLIRGKSGTKVVLQVRREGMSAPLQVTITRAQISAPTVNATYEGNRTAEIQITQFAESTTSQFESSLAAMQAESKRDGGPLRGLILDLRQNPGGLLNVAQEIGSDLLPKGKLIVQIQYPRSGKTYQLVSDKSGLGIPVVCLMDGGTASAAEILAGAMRDSDHGVLVGEKSFGKGTAQQTKSFGDGSTLKYTIAKWLTPNGTWVNKVGLSPQVKVALPSYDNLTGLDPSALLRINMNSSAIATLQKMLIALGYNTDRTDGYFDSTTQTALESFQRANRLTVNGEVDQETAAALNRALAAKISANDTQMRAAKEELRQLLAGKT